MIPTSDRFWRHAGSNVVVEVMQRVPQLFWDLSLARWLPPAGFGTWYGSRVLLQITPQLPAVPLSGLDIKYAGLIRSGLDVRACQTAGLAFAQTILINTGQLVLLGLALFSADLLRVALPGATPRQYLLVLVLVALQGVSGFATSHLRNRLEFTWIGGTAVVGNLLGLAVLIAAVPGAGLEGALIAAIATSAIILALQAVRFSIAMPPPGIWFSEGRILLATGFPLAASVLVMDSTRLASRWAVGQRFGATGLGEYGIAGVFAGAVLLSASAVGRVTMQYVARAEAGTRNRNLLQFCQLPCLAFIAASALVVPTVAALSGVALAAWAPQHLGALTTIRPALYGALALGPILLFLTFLRGSGELRRLFLASGAGLGLQVVAIAVAWGLGSMPLHFVILETLAFAMLLALLVHLTGDDRPTSRSEFGRLFWITYAMTVIATEIAVRVFGAAGASSLSPVGATLQLVTSLLLVGLWLPGLLSGFRRLAADPVVPGTTI